MIHRACSISNLFNNLRFNSTILRDSVIGFERIISTCYSQNSIYPCSRFYHAYQRYYHISSFYNRTAYGSVNFTHFRSLRPYGLINVLMGRGYVKETSNASVELKTDEDVVRFNIGDASVEREASRKLMKATKEARVSRKKKLNELRFYRLKAKKKMNSPNPEVRIRYKLEKAKRKETWLIEKLRKFEAPKAPPETYDPEILTEEEIFYLKRTGERKKHYVPVGRRGVFGGVVLNMHLHWKNHETVKVVCKPCKPGQVHEYAEELERLSKGVVIDIKPNNSIIFYRGKNYVQPDVMSPTNTLSKSKALEKYKYEQSLEHTSQFIEKLENELEEYLEHVARFRKGEKSITGEFK